MIYLNGLNAVSVLGASKAHVLAALKEQRSGFLCQESGFLPEGESACVGRVEVTAASLELRNLTLLDCCLRDLAPVLQRMHEKVRPEHIGIVIGTSTSALTDVELETRVEAGGLLNFDPRVCEIGIISEHIRDRIGALGPCYTVATACSSSARALISARGLIRAGLCDAVIAGGADSLSRVTVGGFHALGALDSFPARPFATDRKGINIGEGAGLCVVSREAFEDNPVKLLGAGASTDAYHVSAPDPSAKGAIAAVKAALADAGLSVKDIGYINMHGTGTRLNDAMEGKLVSEIFSDNVPVSSLKHLTGHTLGAAGIVEAAAVAMMLKDGVPLPYHPYAASEWQEEFSGLDLVTAPKRYPKSSIIMTNNFAFGGNNVSLILGI